MIICLPSDKDNFYVTMTARMLNPAIRIICRMTDPKIEAKLRKAGANQTVSPNFMGTLRMASEIIRPTVVDFLDSMLRCRQGTLRINEIVISGESEMVDRPIRKSGLKDRFNLLVLGSRKEGCEIEFDPPAEKTLEAGTSLIVMGEVENLDEASKVF